MGDFREGQPSGDIVTIPNLAGRTAFDPAGVLNGISSKMIIDATTPVAPDRRGDYGEVLDTRRHRCLARESLATSSRNLANEHADRIDDAVDLPAMPLKRWRISPHRQWPELGRCSNARPASTRGGQANLSRISTRRDIRKRSGLIRSR